VLEIRRSTRFSILGCAALAAILACAGDPGRAIEARRAKYEASLSGFVVKDAPGAEHPTVVLDVLVHGDARPPLSRLTLDISMADSSGKEKNHLRRAVDTGTVGPGGEQIAISLDGLDYVEGDGFWVEVRSPVPPAERGDYVEFRSAE
jgi:hypothetical protein